MEALHLTKAQKHLGKILLSEELLLAWLQFTKASVRNIRLNPDTNVIEIVLEDKEMPLVREGEVIPVVTPGYITTYKKGQIKSIKREKLR